MKVKEMLDFVEDKQVIIITNNTGYKLRTNGCSLREGYPFLKEKDIDKFGVVVDGLGEYCFNVTIK